MYEKLKSCTRGDYEYVEFFYFLQRKIPFCFVRFNDGEMGIVNNEDFTAARGDQKGSKTLRNKLIEALRHTQKNYFVGLPCESCFPKMANLAKMIVKTHQITRATVLTNRNWAGVVSRFADKVHGRSVLWVSGDDQDTARLPFKVTPLKFQRTNSWAVYPGIYSRVKQEANDIVMVSLGPAARVLCYELYKQDPGLTCIDIGSVFDPFTRNVWHNCHKGWLETGFNLVKRCKICN